MAPDVKWPLFCNSTVRAQPKPKCTHTAESWTRSAIISSSRCFRTYARQVGFTEIDLRWGVTEEESKNGATVEICLKEIDRCRDFPPFFIDFLGKS